MPRILTLSAALATLSALAFAFAQPPPRTMEKRVAALESGSGALACASGQAAESMAILNITQAGQNIVSSASLYGGTYNLFHYTFPKLGIRTKFVQQADPENFRKAIDDKTRCVFVETIGNPRVDLPDFEAIAAGCSGCIRRRTTATRRASSCGV